MSCDAENVRIAGGIGQGAAGARGPVFSAWLWRFWANVGNGLAPLGARMAQRKSLWRRTFAGLRHCAKRDRPPGNCRSAARGPCARRPAGRVGRRGRLRNRAVATGGVMARLGAPGTRGGSSIHGASGIWVGQSGGGMGVNRRRRVPAAGAASHRHRERRAGVGRGCRSAAGGLRPGSQPPGIRLAAGAEGLRGGGPPGSQRRPSWRPIPEPISGLRNARIPARMTAYFPLMPLAIFSTSAREKPGAVKLAYSEILLANSGAQTTFPFRSTASGLPR